jgi:hypothetical protein
MKRIFLSFAACFLAYQSIIILVNLDQLRFDSIPGNILLAWVLNMFVTGIFAFLSFAFPVEKTFPAAYFKIYNPSFLKKVYSLLGVEVFRQFLLKTLWRGKQQRKKYFDGSREGLQNFIIQSQQAEWGHLLPFFVLLVYTIGLLGLKIWFLAIMVLFFNVLGNLYPVILQRYHRYRIGLLKARFQSKSS